ncbi:hypothetical protein M0811_09578 [Anaeramoeba ignava]|uniref:Uncharacterized protein n=1 Tax=Anaeramoeba ignava TaxID=1746090 RepID=A0A9Q0LG90_ANAIG|nr:hypothetical protein M0811_09578 [Anaeramoeba ignava]
MEPFRYRIGKTVPLQLTEIKSFIEPLFYTIIFQRDIYNSEYKTISSDIMDLEYPKTEEKTIKSLVEKKTKDIADFFNGNSKEQECLVIVSTQNEIWELIIQIEKEKKQKYGVSIELSEKRREELTENAKQIIIELVSQTQLNSKSIAHLPKPEFKIETPKEKRSGFSLFEILPITQK